MSVMKIAHLSDPHFGTILPGVREGLLQTLRELKPDLILLTGDITQRARRAQFAEAKKFTHDLGNVPLIAVPGNHDIPLFNIIARIFYPYWGFRKLFKDHLEKDHWHGDIAVSGLNSTSPWRHVQGELNLRKVRKKLQRKHKEAKIHIVAFHHPMDCDKPQDEKNLLINREESMKVFAQNDVDLVIGGHIHDPYVGLSSVRYPEIRRSMILGVAGTCTSWRTRKNAPNSFHFMEVNTSTSDKSEIKITRYDQNETLNFKPVRDYQFERIGANGWKVI